MSIKKPHEYSKRIVLAVAGLTPQVITETIYALAHQDEPFKTTELRIMTTVKGKNHLIQELINTPRINNLCKDYQLDIEFSENHIEIIHDRNQQPLDDIQTVENNEDCADAISRFIEKYTRNEDSAVHVTIAGGRRTMIVLTAYALSLFARPQDRLSHILVNPNSFEFLDNFYYPPKIPMVIEDKNGNLLNTADAKLTLGDVPFVKLSSGLPADLINRENNQVSYSKTVRSIQAVVENEPYLEINLKDKTVKVGQEGHQTEIKLQPKHFAWYSWFAYNTLNLKNYSFGKDDLNEDEESVAEDFIRFCKKVYNDMSGNLVRIEESLETKNGFDFITEKNQSYVSECNSRIKTAFEKKLGQNSSKPYIIQTIKRGSGRYHLTLNKNQIKIIN